MRLYNSVMTIYLREVTRTQCSAVRPTWRSILLIFSFYGKFHYWIALDVAYIVTGISPFEYRDSHYILRMCEQKIQQSKMTKLQK